MPLACAHDLTLAYTTRLPSESFDQPLMKIIMLSKKLFFGLLFINSTRDEPLWQLVKLISLGKLSSKKMMNRYFNDCTVNETFVLLRAQNDDKMMTKVANPEVPLA